jgi:Cu-Zn family superoxide dismutase
MKISLPTLGLCAVIALAWPAQAEEKAADVTKAVAVLVGTNGNEKVSGVITFTKEGDGVRVRGEIKGLSPGEHGFHVHEFGDQSSPDGTAAGGHFNPTGMPHGAPDAEKRHTGDMGNVTADASGVAKVDYVDPELAFDGSKSILGRGVVVHAKADDLKTQPTGDAGGRLAVGVIGVAK